jgi:hypothetical protein
VLGEIPEVAAHLDAKALQHLEDPEEYLGSAEHFRKALLCADHRTKDRKEE